MDESAEASPCTNVCRLDARGRVCVGCGRTIDEIAGWPSFTASERRQVIDRLERLRRGDGGSARGEPPAP